MKTLICGIDFGTTKSGLAIIENGIPNVVRNIEYQDESNDNSQLDSWALPTQMLVTTGVLGSKDYAYHLLEFELDNTVNYEKAMARPGIAAKFLSGSLKLRLGEEVKFVASSLQINDLVAEFLRRLVSRITGNEEPDIFAVIGVPAEFNYQKRKSLIYAAHLAGFTRALLLPEPLAGILTILESVEDNEKGLALKDKLVLVIDYGGGTCNYAIIDFLKQTDVEVLHAGAVHRGGETITQKLMDEFAPQNINDEVDRVRVYKAINVEKIQFGSRITEGDWPDKKIDISPVVSLSGQVFRFKGTKRDFDRKIREAVTAVRDEVSRMLDSRKEEWIDPLDAVIFLGESRHLYCFKDIFWDNWLAQTKSKPKQYGLGDNHSLHVSPQMVTEGCALYASRLYRNLFGKVIGFLLPFVIRTQWKIQVRLLTLDGQPLPHQLWHLNDPLNLASGKKLPFTQAVHFQIFESTKGFKVQFSACNENQSVEELETYTVAPKRAGAVLPAYAYVDLRFRVRSDGLIEIKYGIASRAIFRTIFGRQDRKDRNSNNPEKSDENLESAGIGSGMIIRLDWKSDFEHLDYHNIVQK